MKLILLLYMCHSMMGFTRCYKTKVFFYIYICCFQYQSITEILLILLRQSQSTAKILLLPVSKNKWLPFWNSTSGFDFALVTVISMWFCTGLPNFMQIGWLPTESWRFGYVWHLGMSKAIGTPNFDQISQSTAEILLLPISRNKWPPY